MTGGCLAAADLRTVGVGFLIHEAIGARGMIVRHNDLIHADRHGAVVIPHDVARKVDAAAKLLARREKVLLDAAKQPGFSVAELRKALSEADEIH